jgi:hypothetical protein
VGIDRAFRARVGVAASRAHLENEPTRRPNLGVHVAVSRRVTGAAVLLGLPTRSILLQLTPEMQPSCSGASRRPALGERAGEAGSNHQAGFP